MNHLFRSLFAIALLGASSIVPCASMAQQNTPSTPTEQTTPSAAAQTQVERADDEEAQREEANRSGEDEVILHIGDDSVLPAGQTADAVIAILGSTISEGKVRETVVAIGGNARITGYVGDAVVVMLGDAYINAEIGHDVAAILGNVRLGPNALVHGEVTSLAGTITREPGAIIEGGHQEIAFGSRVTSLEGLRAWFRECLLYGRPLAFDADVQWAWWLSFAFLALYVVIALLFDTSVQRCVDTLENRPGQSVLASIITVVMSPMVLLLLLVTVIGIALIPFLAIALFFAALFGKAVVLGALGRRITRFTGIGPWSHIAFSVLVGGLIALLLYVIPVFGYIAYNVIGVLGLGTVIYTLILILRPENAPAPAVASAAAGPTIATTDVAEPAPAVASPSPSTANIGLSNVELNALPRAGFWMRMAALFIDTLIIAVIVNWFEPTGNLMLIALAGYGALMWKLKSTTIGGIVCNLRVVRTDSRDMTWETAIVRALSCFLSLVPAGLGFIWMVFDNNRQTWHDKIAGTVVVRVPRNQPLM